MAAPTFKSIHEFLWELPTYIDRWRIVPRALMGAYVYEMMKVTHWFMTVPDPNTAQSTVLSIVWGTGAAWFALYLGKPGASND